MFGCWKTLVIFKVFARAEQTEDFELRDPQVHFKLSGFLVVKSSEVSYLQTVECLYQVHRAYAASLREMK